MAAPDLSHVVTAREAAECLGLSRQQVTRLLRQGKIAGAARLDGAWLIDRDEFEAYLRARRGEAVPEQVPVGHDRQLEPVPAWLGAEGSAAEEELGHWRLEAVLESLQEGLIFADGQGTRMVWNPAALTLLGFDDADSARLSPNGFFAGFETRALDGRLLADEEWPMPRLLRGESFSDDTLLVRRLDQGWERVISFSGTALKDESGQVLTAVLTFRDMTARVRAEREREQALARMKRAHRRVASLAKRLQKERDLCTAITENTRTQLAYFDTSFNFVRANSAYAEDTNHRPEDLVGRNHFALFPNDFNQAVFERVRATRRAESFLETPYVYPDHPERGTTYWDWTLAPVLDRRERLQGLVISLSDVTESVRARLRVAELAAEAERRAGELDAIITAAADGLVLYDLNGIPLRTNAAARELMGFGDDLWPIPLEHLSAPVQGLKANGQPFQPEELPTNRALKGERVEAVLVALDLPGRGCEATRPGRGRRWVLTSSAPTYNPAGDISGAVTTFRDITEQRKMEEELLKANKLESLGVLAGGIAHDFNNLLTGVIGNITLARLELQGNPEVAELLDEADRASSRAKGLTQQLLTFAKGGEPIRRPLHLPEVLRDAATFALRGSPVAAHFGFASDLWPVEADPGQIGQVIQNLVINAKEAMLQGGIVTVRAWDYSVSTPADSLPLPPGNYVHITVEDSGSGIPREILSRIFDPYFTTKPKGSGIGLSVAYSVVVKHDGYITVETEPGRGSKFHIYLPALAQAGDELPPPALEVSRQRLLLMDDEQIVVRVARKMLERSGYEVETAADGAQAVELYAQALAKGRPFAAVILDLLVPGGVGGREALAQLKQIDPQVRAIVVSSAALSRPDASDTVMTQYSGHGFAAAIAKPFDLERLRATVAEVVGAK